MRLSNERIKALQVLLRELHGLELTDGETQEAGLSIMRFLKVKSQREHELLKLKDNKNGQPKRHNPTK